jgi:hypothetical protein
LSKLVSAESNPSKVPHEVPGYLAISKSNNEHLGSIGLELTARHLIVAGYLYIRMTIPSVKQSVKIADLRVNLLQDWKLQSLVEPERCQIMPQKRFSVWSMRDGAVAAGKDAKSRFSEVLLEADQDWSLNTRFVLPDDKRLRASTLPTSKTGLRVTHKLALTLSYYVKIPNDDSANLSKLEEIHFEVPAIFSSCYCVLDALQLPQYVESSEQDRRRLPFLGCDCRNECSQFGPPAETSIKSGLIHSSSVYD